jgi:hypothetical protein
VNSSLWWKWTYAFAQALSDMLEATLVRVGDLPEITVSLPLHGTARGPPGSPWPTTRVDLKESLIPLAVERLQNRNPRELVGADRVWEKIDHVNLEVGQARYLLIVTIDRALAKLTADK